MEDLPVTVIQAALLRLETQLSNLQLIQLNTYVFGLAETMIDTHRIRALDALQLASALSCRELDTVTFVCADRRLLKASTAEGLSAIDPVVST